MNHCTEGFEAIYLFWGRLEKKARGNDGLFIVLNAITWREAAMVTEYILTTKPVTSCVYREKTEFQMQTLGTCPITSPDQGQVIIFANFDVPS